ncbi:UDP-N-acetylmuramate dehydrogenase [Chromatiaceae bacterium AAb-1]|nr:UDP-N-acetylmuramate dehydrogenase [Chromatiaceae bacterium AAb-1]
MHIFSDQKAEDYSTFRLAHTLEKLIEFESVTDLQQYQPAGNELVLGEGSNTIFLDSVSRPVCRYIADNKVLIPLDTGYFLLHVAGGHNWHELVKWAVDQELWGIENLALIPGSVGAAPVQNIGAYGVELADVCLYVDFFHWQTKQVQRLTAAQCRFAYRDSIFKQALSGKGIIVAVGLLLQQQPKPVLTYKGLDHLPADTGLSTIYLQVIETRNSKLPAPAELANCGSFFKNPVLSAEQFNLLKHQFPDMPGFIQADLTVKVPAAWFIDQQGFKGYRYKNVGCYPKQPLVLVNYGKGTAEELLALKTTIQEQVSAVYQVWLEPEVRLIARNGLYEQK